MKAPRHRKKATRMIMLRVSLLRVAAQGDSDVCADSSSRPHPQGFQKKAADEKEAARSSRRR